MPRRCAFGCPSKGTSLHRFPDVKKFPERFQAWVNLVSGQLESAPDFEFYKKKMVCDRHFTNEDRDRNNRLNALAIPSLHLHGVSIVENKNKTDNQTMEASTSTLSCGTTSPGEIFQPSSTGGPVIECLKERQNQVNVDISTPNPPRNIHDMFWQPSNQGQIVAPPMEELAACASTTSHGTRRRTNPSNRATASQHYAAADYVTMEHNYSAISKTRSPFTKDSLKGKILPCSSLRPLHTKIRFMRSEISRLRKRAKTYKSRLESAEKMFQCTSIQNLVENMTSPAQLFIHMQLQTAKKPKGRRFSLEEKILALSLYKKSPKCYSLLHKYFTLPSVKAMKRLLGQIKLCPGINPIIFNKIKDTINKLPNKDKLCSLIFDEMSLTPQVSYDNQKDILEGFSFNNNGFADHVMVFMIKSITNNFKQPVAYYFTSRLNKIDLKKIIREVVIACQNAGIIIINTVCDQSTVNVSAITELIEETKRLFFKNGKEWRHDVIRINKKNIIPIYDTPHLIKGIRNNLLTKDMSYKIDDEESIVKWEYYQKLYTADLYYEEDELRMIPKITEEHVIPEKINKMRVKTATQIFSHSVAVAAEHLTARGDLPKECKQLIKITLLLDNLFDSLNVSKFLPDDGKKYKGAVKQNSCHHKLWKSAKLIFKTIRFKEIKRNGNKTRLIEKVVPSVTNFIKTIEGMEAIWDLVSKKYGFDSLLTRNFNQDPAENFFGSIRSYGARNNAPNSVAFQAAFKALLLNNYNSPHSKKANCEDDGNKCLQSLKFFLTENNDDDASDVPTNKEEILCNYELFELETIKETDAGQRNYVCGWVLKKCLKNIIKGCKHCKKDILLGSNEKNDKNDFIKAKEYIKNNKWLCYPNKATENAFQDLQHTIVSFLKRNVPKKNVKKNIKTFADAVVSYPFTCPTHKDLLEKYFIDTTFNVILHSWCKSVNRILSGKLIYEGDDETKILAQNYYNKHKHYKNKK